LNGFFNLNKDFQRLKILKNFPHPTADALSATSGACFVVLGLGVFGGGGGGGIVVAPNKRPTNARHNKI
tara:strand:+ start:120 stop:326 length:207 start_codon:yes stop_codon:yes gene_type:complete